MLRIPGQEMSSYIAESSLHSHSFENFNNFLPLPGHIFPSLQNERVESDELQVIFQILLDLLPIQSGLYLIVSPQCDKKSAIFREGPFKFESQLIRDLGKTEHL